MTTEEKQIENSIIDYLRALGHKAWAMENTPTYDPKSKRFRRFNTKYKDLGLSDIGCVLSGSGTFAALEVKTEKERLRIENNLEEWLEAKHAGKKWSDNIERYITQWYFIREVIEKGGVGGFVSSIECVKKLGII